MINSIFFQNSIQRLKVITPTLFFLFVYCLLPTNSFAKNSKQWIGLAENALIYEGNYVVDRETEVYKKQKSKIPLKSSNILIQKSSSQLKHTKDKGLKPFKSKKNGSKSPSSSEFSGFTLDVSHMLKKMKGKVQWTLEDENASLDNMDCVILRSSGDKWLVKLWIKKLDGVVLRYDQYLNDKFIGSSTLEYEKPKKGKYFPNKSKTDFRATGHLVIQHYDNYVFE